MVEINPYESPNSELKVKNIEEALYTPFEIMKEIFIPGYAIYNGVKFERAIARDNCEEYLGIKSGFNEYVSMEVIKLILGGLITASTYSLYN